MRSAFLVLLAAVFALGLVACGGEGEEAATATPSPAVHATAALASPTIAAATTAAPEARPPAAPVTWRDVGELVAAAGVCQEHLVPGWNVGDSVRTDWALPRLEEGEEMNEWTARLDRMATAANALEANLQAIYGWLDARYGRPASADVLTSIGKEPDFTPLFVQCVRDALSGVTPAAEPPTGRSRTDPTPLGQTAVVPPGWQVTVLDVNPDAWPVVQAENTFNDPPKEGLRMVLITVRVTNVQGKEEADTITEADFELVGSSNQVYKTFDQTCGVTPNDLSAELFPQGTAEGTVCFQAGVDETGLLLIASLTWDDKDRRYLALE